MFSFITGLTGFVFVFISSPKIFIGIFSYNKHRINFQNENDFMNASMLLWAMNFIKV